METTQPVNERSPLQGTLDHPSQQSSPTNSTVSTATVKSLQSQLAELEKKNEYVNRCFLGFFYVFFSAVLVVCLILLKTEEARAALASFIGNSWPWIVAVLIVSYFFWYVKFQFATADSKMDTKFEAMNTKFDTKFDMLLSEFRASDKVAHMATVSSNTSILAWQGLQNQNPQGLQHQNP